DVDVDAEAPPCGELGVQGGAAAEYEVHVARQMSDDLEREMVLERVDRRRRFGRRALERTRRTDQVGVVVRVKGGARDIYHGSSPSGKSSRHWLSIGGVGSVH